MMRLRAMVSTKGRTSREVAEQVMAAKAKAAEADQSPEPPPPPADPR
jgi:hypothetical protein